MTASIFHLNTMQINALQLCCKHILEKPYKACNPRFHLFKNKYLVSRQFVINPLFVVMYVQDCFAKYADKNTICMLLSYTIRVE